MRRSVRPWLAFGVTCVLACTGCELDVPELEERNEQSIPDATKRVGSIGDSFTAGFQNGGIRGHGQFFSFANQVARVFQEDPAFNMTMPLVADPGIGSELGLSPLFVDESGDVTREPLTQFPADMALALTFPLPYDNLGIPGSSTQQQLEKVFGDDGVGGDNALFDLILRSPQDGSGVPFAGSAMSQLGVLHPAYITGWTGIGEILGALLTGEPQGIDPGAPGFVVPVSVYRPIFVQFLDAIAALEPEIVAIANIPPLTSLPYARFFGTGSVPGVNRWNMDEDCDEYPGGECPVDEFDRPVPDSDPAQIVLLPAPLSDCINCYLFTCSNDCRFLPVEVTLSVSEVALINDTVAAYNELIEEEVTRRGWAFVDIHARLSALSTSSTATPLNGAFPWQVNPLTGVGTQNRTSAFTLDGLHTSEKGAADVANAFLEAIDETYGTNLGRVDLTAIDNTAGFERAPSNKWVGEAVITSEGRAGLRGLREMFVARF